MAEVTTIDDGALTVSTKATTVPTEIVTGYDGIFDWQL
jgi:hypothetical protein